MCNIAITYVDVRRRLSPDDPAAFERGGECVRSLREHIAQTTPEVRHSDNPESLIKSFQTRMNEIVDEYGFPMTHRLG